MIGRYAFMAAGFSLLSFILLPMEELKEGDLRSEIKLRRNDILQDMAATLNDCTGSLKKKIKMAQENQAQLEKTLRKSTGINDAFGKLKKNLGSFKTF